MHSPKPTLRSAPIHCTVLWLTYSKQLPSSSLKLKKKSKNEDNALFGYSTSNNSLKCGSSETPRISTEKWYAEFQVLRAYNAVKGMWLVFSSDTSISRPCDELYEAHIREHEVEMRRGDCEYSQYRRSCLPRYVHVMNTHFFKKCGLVLTVAVVSHYTSQWDSWNLELLYLSCGIRRSRDTLLYGEWTYICQERCLKTIKNVGNSPFFWKKSPHWKAHERKVHRYSRNPSSGESCDTPPSSASKCHPISHMQHMLHTCHCHKERHIFFLTFLLWKNWSRLRASSVLFWSTAFIEVRNVTSRSLGISTAVIVINTVNITKKASFEQYVFRPRKWVASVDKSKYFRLVNYKLHPTRCNFS
jgi:hypothetical protein